MIQPEGYIHGSLIGAQGSKAVLQKIHVLCSLLLMTVKARHVNESAA